MTEKSDFLTINYWVVASEKDGILGAVRVS